LISLPDVNVLLALAWSNHVHHASAHAWFAKASGAGWATCILTQSAFLRLSLNPQVVGVSLDCQSAIKLLTTLVSHPQHQYPDVAPAITRTPFEQLIPRINGYHQVSDATLLHFARFHNMKLVTFDQAFSAVSPWSQNLEVLVP
jgi:toxin-antitoxin system PIN domain toxin